MSKLCDILGGKLKSLENGKYYRRDDNVCK